MGNICLSVLYSLACVCFPCMVYQWISEIRNYGNRKKGRIAHFVWVYIFLVYLWMVFQVTGIGLLADIRRKETDLFMGEINYVPFDSFGMGYILNIIMCMPLGFLLPLIWKEYRRIGKTVIIGAIFSILIEITQLFNFRASDIDDLTANTCGALLGYLIWKIYMKIIGRCPKEGPAGRQEALLYILLALLGTFFLYNPYVLYSL